MTSAAMYDEAGQLNLSRLMGYPVPDGAWCRICLVEDNKLIPATRRNTHTSHLRCNRTTGGHGFAIEHNQRIERL